MATFVLTGEYLTVNSVNYSDHMKSAVLTFEVAEKDTTSHASGGWEEVKGGLKRGTLAVEFMDDVADNDIDEELFALLGTVVAYALRPTSDAISTANPEYQGSVLITSHSIGGGVGDLATKSLTWPTSGAPTRDVTP